LIPRRWGPVVTIGLGKLGTPCERTQLPNTMALRLAAAALWLAFPGLEEPPQPASRSAATAAGEINHA
jgi:hypothetical protein